MDLEKQFPDDCCSNIYFTRKWKIVVFLVSFWFEFWRGAVGKNFRIYWDLKQWRDLWKSKFRISCSINWNLDKFGFWYKNFVSFSSSLCHFPRFIFHFCKLVVFQIQFSVFRFHYIAFSPVISHFNSPLPHETALCSSSLPHRTRKNHFHLNRYNFKANKSQKIDLKPTQTNYSSLISGWYCLLHLSFSTEIFNAI